MPSLLISTWVKNVYSLLIVEGKTGAHLPTTSRLTGQFTHSPVHNTLILPRFIPLFPLQLSTKKITNSYLLHNHLYPLSTPPINTKTKGK